METYKVNKRKNDVYVIEELNARVWISTFENKEGLQEAQLLTHKGTQCKNPDEVVSINSKGVPMAKVVKKILIQF